MVYVANDGVCCHQSYANVSGGPWILEEGALVHKSTLHYYLLSHKKHFKQMKTYRDGIPKKQPNKVGTNDTTVPLWTPIPISLNIVCREVVPISEDVPEFNCIPKLPSMYGPKVYIDAIKPALNPPNPYNPTLILA